jgi:catechol 2,3-dioxygenase-like lactoylglutathione lyase family enzyme
MYSSINLSQVFVLDQDEALAWYTEKLGLEVAADQDLGFMRWLTVSVPGDPSRQILLERPGAPAMSDEAAGRVADLLTTGAAGGWFALTTDDAHAAHATLVERGVEITDEPTDKGYGVDFGVRDPFGNRIRIGQLHGA